MSFSLLSLTSLSVCDGAKLVQQSANCLKRDEKW